MGTLKEKTHEKGEQFAVITSYHRGSKEKEKHPCFSNYFFQLESPKNERDRVSCQILYPTIYSNKPFSR